MGFPVYFFLYCFDYSRTPWPHLNSDYDPILRVSVNLQLKNLKCCYNCSKAQESPETSYLPSEYIPLKLSRIPFFGHEIFNIRTEISLSADQIPSLSWMRWYPVRIITSINPRSTYLFKATLLPYCLVCVTMWSMKAVVKSFMKYENALPVEFKKNFLLFRFLN